MPANMRGRAVVLVQEGMTDPEDLVFQLVKRFRLPPWLTTTSSATGLSHAYDKFCVASDGYRDLFVNKGVARDKIVVTGIPNFDNCARFLRNDFPHRGYVLVLQLGHPRDRALRGPPQVHSRGAGDRRRPAGDLEAAPERRTRSGRAPSSRGWRPARWCSTGATPKR